MIIREKKLYAGITLITPTSPWFYSLEEQLSQLMTDLQSKFKCLGLLDPYTWKTGEACVVRGEDTLWYRGEVVEVGSSTNLVSLTFMFKGLLTMRVLYSLK